MEYARLLQAISFAAFKHRDQRRKDAEGTPYINHPIRVAMNLANAGITDVEILQAAVLHDTVEDTGTSPAEIRANFGERVAGLVMEVTDDKSLTKTERKKHQVVRAATASHGAKLIKLADKLDNLSDQRQSPPQGWSYDRVIGYHIWSFEVVDALRGTNPILEAKLDDLYGSAFYTCGQYHKGLYSLSKEQKADILANYYKLMDRSS